MTVSSSRTRELDINTIVKRAYQLAGLLSADQSDLSAAQGDLARDLLEMEIDAIQSQGYLARAVDFYSLDVTSGTSSYAMPSYVLDVLGDGMYLPDGQTSGESVVSKMSREDYQALTDKTASGRPYRYYLHRTSAMLVYLWPVPDADGTVRLQTHNLLADNNDGSKTIDLERHWVEYVVYALAGKLAMANSLPLDRVSMLEGKAESKLRDAKGASTQGMPNRFVIRHRTPWSR